MPRSSQQSLRLLTRAVWQASGNDEVCPDTKYPTFRQLDDLISTTALGFRRPGGILPTLAYRGGDD